MCVRIMCPFFHLTCSFVSPRGRYTANGIGERIALKPRDLWRSCNVAFDSAQVFSRFLYFFLRGIYPIQRVRRTRDSNGKKKDSPSPVPFPRHVTSRVHALVLRVYSLHSLNAVYIGSFLRFKLSSVSRLTP